MNFDFSIFDVPGEICGKYRLLANLRYLLETDLLDELKVFGAGFENDELAILKSSFIKGFEAHY